MLASPERPLFGISLVIPRDVLPNGRKRAGIDSFLNECLTANFRALVHSENHQVPSLWMINLLHPKSHDVDRAENYITFLFASRNTGKNSRDTVRFDTTLIWKDVARSPTAFISSNDQQCCRNCIVVLGAYQKNELRHPNIRRSRER